MSAIAAGTAPNAIALLDNRPSAPPLRLSSEHTISEFWRQHNAFAKATPASLENDFRLLLPSACCN